MVQIGGLDIPRGSVTRANRPNMQDAIPTHWLPEGAVDYSVARFFGYGGLEKARNGMAPIIDMNSALHRTGDTITFNTASLLTDEPYSNDLTFQGNEESINIRAAQAKIRSEIMGMGYHEDYNHELAFRVSEVFNNHVRNSRGYKFSPAQAMILNYINSGPAKALGTFLTIEKMNYEIDMLTLNHLVNGTFDTRIAVPSDYGVGINPFDVNGGLTYDNIVMISQEARTRGIAPVALNNFTRGRNREDFHIANKYILMVDQASVTELLQDADYKQAVEEGRMRGMDNPIFTGAIAEINGVLVVSYDSVGRSGIFYGTPLLPRLVFDSAYNHSSSTTLYDEITVQAGNAGSATYSDSSDSNNTVNRIKIVDSTISVGGAKQNSVRPMKFFSQLGSHGDASGGNTGIGTFYVYDRVSGNLKGYFTADYLSASGDIAISLNINKDTGTAAKKGTTLLASESTGTFNIKRGDYIEQRPDGANYTNANADDAVVYQRRSHGVLLGSRALFRSWQNIPQLRISASDYNRKHGIAGFYSFAQQLVPNSNGYAMNTFPVNFTSTATADSST